MAPSAQALQSLVDICELELKLLDMAIDASEGSIVASVLLLPNLPACGLAPGTKAVLC